VLLADASVAFREPGEDRFRLLVVNGGQIVERGDLDDPRTMRQRGSARPWQRRQASIDVAGYDRLRVLATELARVRGEGGSILLRMGDRLIGERGAALLVG